MKAKKLIGLLLGMGGFAAAIAFPLEGLGLAGQLTLGIFTLAAVFWIFEPIPIFATSMLVILLQTMLLSSQGFIFSVGNAPKTELALEAYQSQEVFRVPETALSAEETLIVVEGTKIASKPKVVVVANEGEESLVLADELDAGSTVLKNANHRSVTAGANSYAKFYGALSNPIIILFLGGFALAASAVKFGLDRNLTRFLLKPFGYKPQSVCLGLMLCTGALSAFMSNTATTAMMMTVVLPIIAGLKTSDPFRKGAALSIPVAANIGGIATPIGTPPNAIALAALKEQGISISFSSWMMMAAPFAIVLLLIAWKLLMILFKPESDECRIEISGKSKRSPKAFLAYAIFGVTVMLWVTEKLHGLSTSMVAFIPIALLPAMGVLDKKDIRGFSWEVLWLVGGGISLGISMSDTGLAEWIIGRIEWDGFGAIGVVIVFGVVGYLVANLISHTVAATMLMPLAITVGSAIAVTSGDFNLVSSIVAITVIVSCAMVLPISTPPNAIAMSTGFLETKDMARVGIVVGLISVVMAIGFAFFVWPLLY